MMTPNWTEASPAPEILSEVDGNRMWKTLEYFSTLNRDAGSEDEHKACRYVAEQLRSAGVPCDLHECQAYLSHPRSAGLTIYNPRYQTFQALTHSFSGNTPVAGVSGEVVFIGSPEFDPGMEMDTSLFENLNLRGKIVLSEGLVRPWKATVSQARGAIALINVNATDQRHNMIVSTAWGMPCADELHLVPTIPVISLNRNDGQELIRMCRQGRVEATVQSETDTGFFPLLIPVAKSRGKTRRILSSSTVISTRGMWGSPTTQRATPRNWNWPASSTCIGLNSKKASSSPGGLATPRVAMQAAPGTRTISSTRSTSMPWWTSMWTPPVFGEPPKSHPSKPMTWNPSWSLSSPSSSPGPGCAQLPPGTARTPRASRRPVILDQLRFQHPNRRHDPRRPS